MQATIPYAIHNLKERVPSEILNIAFRPDNTNIQYTIPELDSLINRKIIQESVLVDCAISGGKTKRIQVLGSWHEPSCEPAANLGTVGTYSIYRIPTDAREHVDIQSISRVAYMNHGSSSIGHIANSSSSLNSIQVNNGVTQVSLANEVLQSHTASNVGSAPIAELLPGNIIRLNPASMTHVNFELTVKLAYDPDMTGADNSMIRPFARLVELKTKAYIYNKLIITLDEAYIQGGSQLGSIKDTVDQYSDAHEQYEEALLEWRGSNMLDTRSKLELFKYML